MGRYVTGGLRAPGVEVVWNIGHRTYIRRGLRHCFCWHQWYQVFIVGIGQRAFEAEIRACRCTAVALAVAVGGEGAVLDHSVVPVSTTAKVEYIRKSDDTGG